MTKTTLLGMPALFLLAALGYANAQGITKCRSAGGRIIYSDGPCEKLGAKTLGVVDVTPNQVDGIRSAPVPPALPSMQRSPNGSDGAPAITGRKAPDVKARQERERELGLIVNSMTSTWEQKQAAQEELGSIATSGTCKFSESDRKRRDGLYGDLGSLVPQRRAAASGPLRALLASCERI